EGDAHSMLEHLSRCRSARTSDDLAAILARRAEPSLPAGRAAELLLAAAHATPATRATLEERAALVDRAAQLDLDRATGAGPEAAGPLKGAAVAALAASEAAGRAADPELISRARARLLRARLIEPKGAWREAGESLARLARSPRVDVRRAARPWHL